jgi:glycosyltransferase involved in cell wall biosynthesis
VRIAHVSTFPPLKCGIASFAHDLLTADRIHLHSPFPLTYERTAWLTGPLSTVVDKAANLGRLAETISDQRFDAICLQHEFGIWGGDDGEHLLEFLAHARIPILSVLHTTLPIDDFHTRRLLVLRELIGRSRRAIVFTERSARNASALAGNDRDTVRIIPHGVPSVRFNPPPEPTHSSELALVTLGYMRPDKGIEEVLVALRMLRDTGYDATLSILGSAQEHFAGQTDYQRQIVDTVHALRLSEHVQLRLQYQTVAAQLEAIQRSHIGVFAYQSPHHASSGTIPLVLSAGRGAVCTPFEFAVATDEAGPGIRLTGGYAASDIAEALAKEADGRFLHSGAERIYNRGLEWHWDNTAARFAAAFSHCVDSDTS